MHRGIDRGREMDRDTGKEALTVFEPLDPAVLEKF